MRERGKCSNCFISELSKLVVSAGIESVTSYRENVIEGNQNTSGRDMLSLYLNALFQMYGLNNRKFLCLDPECLKPFVYTIED